MDLTLLSFALKLTDSVFKLQKAFSEFISYLFSVFSSLIIYFTGLKNSIMLSEPNVAFPEFNMIF